MQRKVSHFFFISLVFSLSLSLVSCIQTYQPRSEWEEEAFLRTRPDIHPYDVRKQFEKYQYTPVRWAGIIEESEFYEADDAYEIILLIEHRYFDWKVDAMSSPQMYYPSKSGEGLFQTSWFLSKDADLDYFVDRFGSGNMAIVYGLPQDVVDSVVLLQSDYIRIIDRSRFQDDQVDYIPESARNRPVNATSFSDD